MKDVANDKQIRPQSNRLCSKCGASERLVTTLARFAEQPAYKIFECRACGTIDWVTVTE